MSKPISVMPFPMPAAIPPSTHLTCACGALSVSPPACVFADPRDSQGKPNSKGHEVVAHYVFIHFLKQVGSLSI